MTDFNSIAFDHDRLEQLAEYFRLLGDPMRLKILHLLRKGEMSVNEIVEKTESSQPNISKHLSIMRTANVVKRRKEGTCAFFSISAPFIFVLCDTVCNSLDS